MDWRDTIVGPAAGAAGVRGILRLSGPLAAVAVAPLVGEEPSAWRRPFARYASLTLPAWSRRVGFLLHHWPEHRSATGQTCIELHLPGSPALLDAVQTELARRGVRLARPGEFTLRSFLAGKMDLAQAEGVLGLIEADDLRQLQFAIDRRAGDLSGRVAATRSDLLDLLADLEAGLDFVDEDIEFVTREQVAARLRTSLAALESLAGGLTATCIRVDRPRVVLLGPPNAGKSSLFNAATGESGGGQALVSPAPGTTRDYLVALVRAGDFEFEIVDTAGFDTDAESAPGGIFAQAAAERARVAAGADLVALCVPAGTAPPPGWARAPGRLLVRTMADLAPGDADPTADCLVSVAGPPGVEPFLEAASSALLSSRRKAEGARLTARVQTGLETAIGILAETLAQLATGAGDEILALGLREALAHLGEIVGAVHTDDLLDRVFSRFCIGK
ncbi:MAG TPA: GTPase [Planctomycetia bacterium]|nr:GTPase [Planctomycetia bacterium]